MEKILVKRRFYKDFFVLVTNDRLVAYQEPYFK